MSDHTVLLEADFDPKVKKYWVLSPVIPFVILIVTIPLAILIYFIATFFVDKYLKNLSCTLTDRTLDIKKGILNKTESTIPLEKITDLQLFQGPIMRYFGLHGFKVETAGSVAVSAAFGSVAAMSSTGVAGGGSSHAATDRRAARVGGVCRSQDRIARWGSRPRLPG